MKPPSILTKIFYEILLSPLALKQPVAFTARSNLDPNKSRYRRTISVINWLDRAFPGASAKLSRLWNEGQTSFDCFGRENLMLIHDDGRYRLHIVDVGLFELVIVAKTFLEKITLVEKRVKELAFLYKKAKQVSSQEMKNFSSVGVTKGVLP